jgi:hypothetical protein
MKAKQVCGKNLNFSLVKRVRGAGRAKLPLSLF